MRKFLLVLSVLLFAVNAYAVDFEMIPCSSKKPGKVVQNSNCKELYTAEEEILYAKLCEYKNTSLKDAYNNVMKKYAWGIKDYPKDIPSKQYDANGALISTPAKNKVSITYYGEGYYFEGFLVYDEKNKAVKATICQSTSN